MILQLSGGAPVMDGKLGEAFSMQLTVDAVMSVRNLKPGYTYRLETVQDGTGTHTLFFSPIIRNAPRANPLPSSRTYMSFIALDDGNGYLSRIATDS